jgi:hypothetical protein
MPDLNGAEIFTTLTELRAKLAEPGRQRRLAFDAQQAIEQRLLRAVRENGSRGVQSVFFKGLCDEVRAADRVTNAAERRISEIIMQYPIDVSDRLTFRDTFPPKEA